MRSSVKAPGTNPAQPGGIGHAAGGISGIFAGRESGRLPESGRGAAGVVTNFAPDPVCRSVTFLLVYAPDAKHHVDQRYLFWVGVGWSRGLEQPAGSRPTPWARDRFCHPDAGITSHGDF